MFTARAGVLGWSVACNYGVVERVWEAVTGVNNSV